MDNVYYYNRKGQLKLTVGEAPYYMQDGTGEFKNHVWDYELKYGKYSGKGRNKQSYPFSIVITSDDDADFDALCEIFDDDAIAGEQGYFIINGWRLDCVVVKADHEFYSDKDRVISFEAVSESSTWIRKNTTSYDGAGSSGEGSVDYGRDYTNASGVLGRDYNYGYNVSDSHYGVISLPGVDNGFEAIIYGPQEDPAIYLNNYPIRVNISLSENQRLKIVSNGSAERTIKVLEADGSESDAFIYRDKEYTPFIDLGEYTELTYGEVKFDFTTIERRSEPSWT